MTETIFDRLEQEWRHVTRVFHHHSPTLGLNRTDHRKQGAIVSLLSIVEEGKTLLEDGESKVRTFLDQHVPQITDLANLIESNPIFASAENALHIPPAILNGFAKALDELAAQYPKPGETTPAAPAAPEQSAQAEPAPEQPAA